MKKRNIIIAFLFLLLIIFTTKVKAADEACKISLSADKTTIEAGDTVTINILVSNVTKTEGIAQFYGVLDFSDDIFEIILDDNDETILEDYEEYKDYSVLYSGRSDETATNPWYMIYVKESGQKGILAGIDTKASDSVQPIKPGDSQIVGKIKFKVKDNAKGTNAKIALTGMEVFGQEQTDSATDTPEGSEISDADVNLTLKEKTTEQPSQTQTKTENQTHNKTTVNDNKATNSVPYTGVEDAIPIILILLVIAIIAYINFIKYKNI